MIAVTEMLQAINDNETLLRLLAALGRYAIDICGIYEQFSLVTDDQATARHDISQRALQLASNHLQHADSKIVSEVRAVQAAFNAVQ